MAIAFTHRIPGKTVYVTTYINNEIKKVLTPQPGGESQGFMEPITQPQDFIEV